MKVFVLGLDGATFDYIDILINREPLVNFKKLKEESSWGSNKSILPPFTAAVWASIYTGKNPGKTGIMDGMTSKKVRRFDNIIPYSARLIGAATLWQWLSKYGKKSILINCPMTYPAEPLNGYLISGFDTPLGVKEICYPANFIDELRNSGINYDLVQRQHKLAINANLWKGAMNIENYISDIEKLIEKQYKIIAHIMKYYQWDFFMTVCQVTDFIAHRTQDINSLVRVYSAIDKFIGKIINNLDNDTIFIIISDHGFQKVKKIVSLNKILIEHELMKFKRELAKECFSVIAARIEKLISLDINTKMLENLWAVFPGWLKRLLSYPIIKMKPRFSRYTSNIDWEKTFVYKISSMGPLYINLKGRDKWGTVKKEDYEEMRKKIIDLFSKFKDPETGEKIFPAIYKSEEIYKGPFVNIGPDLVIQWNDNGIVYFDNLPEEKIFSRTNVNFGFHSTNGIFMIKGNKIKHGYRISDGVSVMDFMPTVLYLLGLPISEEVDGKPLLSAVREEFIKRNPVKYTAEQYKKKVTDKGRDERSPEEIESIKEKLRGLGYID